MSKKRIKSRILLCFALLFLIDSLSPSALPVCAGSFEQTLKLAQAENLALVYNSDYRKKKNKLWLLNVKYQQALKAIALKKKNKAAFRWTPLLSFKFPEKADLADEAEYLYKPLQIQTETNAVGHQLTDIQYEIKETVSNLFVDLYIKQEEIAFYEKRIEDWKVTLSRNRTRLLTGEAYQADVDSMEKALKSLETKLASTMRDFEHDKEKLTDLIRLDVTSGYRFGNPLVDADIERKALEGIVQYTATQDQGLYEAKLDAAAALMTLNSNYGLMRNQYGSRMNRIDSYMNQVKQGEKLDADSFKQQYDALLADVDSPWNGTFRILFFKFPKEWLKGAISGSRYVEDDPYLLYTNALEYQEVLETEKQTEKELKQSVRDSYEQLVSVRNSYLAAQEQAREQQKKVLRGEQLNLAGEMIYEDLALLQEELEEMKQEELESLGTYSQFLYSFDRLTCGAITARLRGTGNETGKIKGGISFVTEEIAEGACYSIQSKIEDNVFELGIYVPDGYELALTDYELWCDEIQVGKRTAIDQTIRHLYLDMQGETKRVVLRFYSGEEFVDDCEIDPQEYSGPLKIIQNYLVEKDKNETWGSFTYSVDSATQLLTLRLSGRETGETAYYRIRDWNEKNLYTDEYVEINQEFVYLSLAEEDLERLEVSLYGKNKELLANVHFDLKTMELTE